MIATFLFVVTALGTALSPPLRTHDVLDEIRAEEWAAVAPRLEEVVRANPYDGTAFYYLGAAQQRLGNHDDAADALERAIGLGVNGSRSGMRAAHLALARSLADLGEEDRAASVLGRAHERWGLTTPDIPAPALEHPALEHLAASSLVSRSDGWRADIDVFVALCTRVHPDPFRIADEASWRADAAALAADVDRVTDLEIVGELMRLMAQLGDGHSSLLPPMGNDGGWHLLPIVPMLAADGWIVQAAPEAQAELVGCRLLSAQGLEWGAVADRARSLVSADNDVSPRWLAGVALQFAETYALATGSREVGPVTFDLMRPDGDTLSVTLPPGPIDRDPTARATPENWRSVAAPPPLWIRHAAKPYHLTEIRHDVIYAQLNQTLDPDDRSLGDVGADIVEAMGSPGRTTLILDLRNNNGGNAHHADNLVAELLRVPKLRERGHLRVLTGPRTYSASGYLLGSLERYFEPELYGWPTGCRPVGLGSERPFTLPHSGLSGTLSWEFRVDGRSSDDMRPYYVPDWVIWPSSEDLRLGRDPVLAAALAGLTR